MSLNRFTWADNQEFYPITDERTKAIIALVRGHERVVMITNFLQEGKRPLHLSQFAGLAAKELSAARATYPAMHSIEESYAVLLEELQEVWEEIRRKPDQRRPDHLLKELTQLAAMAQRAAEDLGYVES